MQAGRSAVSPGGMLGRLGLCVAIGSAIAAVGGRSRAHDAGPVKPDLVALGYEIFNREWLPLDQRSHGGDGLGPVYNDTSCVACHNAGGSGGAGPANKNIDILSATREFGTPVARTSSDSTRGERTKSPVPSDEAALAPRETLADRHAGFRTSRTVVLHKFGTDHNYDSWRSRLLQSGRGGNADRVSETRREALEIERDPGVDDESTAVRTGSTADRAADRIREIRATILANDPGLRQSSTPVGGFVVARSQRNPTPLFGLGLIDAIPDKAIEDMAKRELSRTARTMGRVSRLKDGRIGRLGWKGQTANTEDFVLNACAVELGLEIPGHPQAMVPQAPKYRSPGLDLNAGECAALVAYVRSLPAPVERPSTDADEARQIHGGQALFASIGCTNCHAPRIGDVQGIYSDLLLHDMGGEMGGSGSYDPGDPGDSGDDSPPPSPDDGAVAAKDPAPVQTLGQRRSRGATAREWRTPPLWGFRDSGPYLHDGRAQTLEQAVAMHGGQGADSSHKFFELAPKDRLQIETFLKSLVAPPSVQLARRGD